SLPPSVPICHGHLQTTGSAELCRLAGPHRGVLAACQARRAGRKQQRPVDGPCRAARARHEKEVRKDEFASGVSVPTAGGWWSRVFPSAMHVRSAGVRQGGDEPMKRRAFRGLIGAAAFVVAVTSCQQSNTGSTPGGKPLILESTT